MLMACASDTAPPTLSLRLLTTNWSGVQSPSFSGMLYWVGTGQCTFKLPGSNPLPVFPESALSEASKRGRQRDSTWGLSLKTLAL